MAEEKGPEKGSDIPAFGATGRRVGDYLLGQMIGAGGMGSVFLAKQISMQRLVAVKILRADYSAQPEYTERFFREVRLLAKLENPYIVQAIEAGVDKWTCFFAMEYVDGRDLRTELAIQERLTEKEVLSAARDVARAMGYAWSKFNMVHRDIKPANIMRTRSGGTKLLDVGISKIINPSGRHTELTSSGVMIGSPVYISPEQARGSKEIDFRSDIYSLGITMYHLLSGHPPYDSPNAMSVVSMHLKNPVPILRKEAAVTPGTSTLIHEMMSKDPAGRPASWEEIERRTTRLLAQFETVPISLADLADVDGDSVKKGTKPSESFPHRKKFLLAAVTGLLILAVLLSVLIFFIRKNRTAAPAAGQGNVVENAVPAGPKTDADAVRQPTPDSDPAERRKTEMTVLLRLSGERETAKDFAGALRIWQNYRPPADLQNDPELQRNVAEQIRYLEERLRRQSEDVTP